MADVLLNLQKFWISLAETTFGTPDGVLTADTIFGTSDSVLTADTIIGMTQSVQGRRSQRSSERAYWRNRTRQDRSTRQASTSGTSLGLAQVGLMIRANPGGFEAIRPIWANPSDAPKQQFYLRILRELKDLGPPNAYQSRYKRTGRSRPIHWESMKLGQFGPTRATRQISHFT